jgi:hypothetical protein
MKKIILIIILCLLFQTSCDLTSPKEVDNMQILNIFEEIKVAFDFNDLAGIMSHYHPEFLNNANDWVDEEIIWQIRLNDYAIFYSSNHSIDINGNFAVVSFQMQLDDEYYSEPTAENGDLSYFYKTPEGWMICGNEFSP